jgi:TolA-binding protein
MAQQRGQDILSRLADRGEDVLGRITELPGAQRLVETTNQLKERADEMQKRLRGLEALERRVDALERKVDALSKGSSSGRGAGGPKRAATTKRTTRAKPKPKPSG